MQRAFTLPAVAVTTALLVICCAGTCTAAARPLGRQAAASSEAATSALALAPAGQRRAAAAADADAAAREGKWLPFAGAGGGGIGHHVPAAFWAHRPMPWVGVGGGAPPSLGGSALEGGEEEELLRDRQRERERSYEGGRATTSRQEQLAMWASLLNPKRKRRPAAGWLPGTGIGEAAEDEPAKASDAAAAEGTEVDDTAGGGLQQVGQAKSGFYWANDGN